MDDLIGLQYYQTQSTITCWDMLCVSKQQWLMERMNEKRREDVALLSPKGYCFYCVNGNFTYYVE